MLIVLPNKGSSIQDVKLDGFNLANLEQRLDFGPTLVQLPKFKAKLRTNLKEPLRQLGVETLFDSKRVNLTDISEEEQLSGMNKMNDDEYDE